MAEKHGMGISNRAFPDPGSEKKVQNKFSKLKVSERLFCKEKREASERLHHLLLLSLGPYEIQI